MSQWIESQKELPPCDGTYQVTNHTDSLYDLRIFAYDGYGFTFDGIYREPKFWRKITELHKKYGKQ